MCLSKLPEAWLYHNIMYVQRMMYLLWSGSIFITCHYFANGSIFWLDRVGECFLINALPCSKFDAEKLSVSLYRRYRQSCGTIVENKCNAKRSKQILFDCLSIIFYSSKSWALLHRQIVSFSIVRGWHHLCSNNQSLGQSKHVRIDVCVWIIFINAFHHFTVVKQSPSKMITFRKGKRHLGQTD